MKKLIFVLSTAMLLTACGDASSAKQTAETTQATTAANITLGETTTVTTETTAPVEGAVLLGSSTQTDTQPTTSTDADNPVETAPLASTPAVSNGSFSAADLAIICSGITLQTNTSFADGLAAFGEPDSLFTAPSCVYEGDDKTYTYEGLTVYTYPAGSTDKIAEVEVTGAGAKTSKGLQLGMTLQQVEVLYGTGYTMQGSSYRYTAGDAYLYFSVSAEQVTRFGIAAVTE